MSTPSCSSNGCNSGFTLIEVIGALVIFSVGVLMVLQLSGALGTQMSYAGGTSQLAVLANERLDSLEAEPFASLTPGVETDTVTVDGVSYERVVTIASLTPLLARIDVSLTPIADGPTYAVTSYASTVW